MSIYFVFALGVLNGIIPNANRVVLPLYALELGARPLTVGILAATFSVLPMLLSVPAGKLADRYGARRLLMVTGVLGALGTLAPYLYPGLPAIFVAAALAGMAVHYRKARSGSRQVAAACAPCWQSPVCAACLPRPVCSPQGRTYTGFTCRYTPTQ